RRVYPSGRSLAQARPGEGPWMRHRWRIAPVLACCSVSLLRAGCGASAPTEQGDVQTEIKNDLGQPVWMAVCEDTLCHHSAPGGGQIGPGDTFPQATGPDEQQILLVRGLPASSHLGSLIGTGPDRCVSLSTGDTVS